EQGRVQIAKAMTDAEKAQEQRLNAEVVSLSTQINRQELRQQPDKSALSELAPRLQKARANYEAFQIELYAAHPELKVQRGQIKHVDAAEAAALMPSNDAAMLEYAVTETCTYLFVLTKRQTSRAQAGSTALNVFKIEVGQKELADRVERFRGRLSSKDSDYSELAMQLYNLLMGPARILLKNKSQIVIVPDGVLWDVPFQALQSSAVRFVIEDHAISYAPSLSALREMINLKHRRTQSDDLSTTLVAFGNPDIDPSTRAGLGAAYPEVMAGAKLLPLPE